MVPYALFADVIRKHAVGTLLRYRNAFARSVQEPQQEAEGTGLICLRVVSSSVYLNNVTLSITGRYALDTHVGCEHGVCGACTIRVDGAMARACLMLAVQVNGADIDTVEGLETAPGQLSILQAAFKRHFALQCGFCTAGILMSLDTLLTDEPDADEERLRDVLSGHLCRCTGYEPILRAALAAADELRKEQIHA